MGRLISQHQQSSSPEAYGLWWAEIQELKRQLARIHGTVLDAPNDASGFHFRIACPDCLETDADELSKKHLYINVTKLLAGNPRATYCVKEGVHNYSIPELLAMPPLAQRDVGGERENHRATYGDLSGFQPNPYARIDRGDEDLYEPDETGNIVPKAPGKVIPLPDLAPDHPAMVYIAHRQFTAEALWQQFRAGYCEQENNDFFYPALSGGFRRTPQGRIILFAYQNGARVGWQARLLEMDDGDQRYVFHPYRRTWVHVLTRNAEGEWKPIPSFSGWDMPKYLTARGAHRNRILFGFDAALQWNLQAGNVDLKQRWCILSEGPLDAGRLGPPALALIGKSLSDDQATLLENTFYRVAVLMDNDRPGQQARDKIMTKLTMRNVRPFVMPLPTDVKDPGELSAQNAELLFRKANQMAYNR